MIAFDDLVFQILFRMMYLQLIVHEYSHLLALRLMGYTGEIRSTMLNAVFPTQYSLMQPWQKTTFYFSGGLGQALTFSLMCLYNKDEENRLVNKMIAVWGLIYGAFEAFAPRAWWDLGSVIGLMISIIFMTLVLVEKSNKDQSPFLPTLD